LPFFAQLTRRGRQMNIGLKTRLDLMFAPFRRQLAGFDAVPQLAILGLVSGIVTGLVIVLFRLAIEIPLALMLPGSSSENFEGISTIARLSFPLCGALFIGILLFRLKVHLRKVGVTHVLERLGYHQGHISWRNGVLQFIVGAATVISGQSAGREGPAVHLGATVSSLLGQWAALPNNSIRMLVGCGTAAAISASFNTPLAGIIFAMEVVLMEYTIVGFTPIILAAVSAAVVTQFFYGNEPAFLVPDIAFQSLAELPLILAATLPLALAACVFNQTVLTTSRHFQGPILSRLMLAGLLTGLAGIAFPEIMGVGYDSVNTALLGGYAAPVLLTLGLAKLFVTSISIGLGMPSGIIGPTLFIGACLGGALGMVAQALMPAAASDAGFYALLGMGAMMGAVLQAPLAAIIAIIELTRTSNIMLPTMIIIIVTGLLTRNLFRQKPIFIALLQAQGLDYRFEPLTQALRRISVAAIMERRFIRTKAEHSLEEAHALLKNSPVWILIEDQNGPVSLMPAVDLSRYLELLDEENRGSDDALLSEEIEGTQIEPEPSEHADLQPSAGTDDTEEAQVSIRVNLLKIPAQRRDLAPLHIQATLEEALAVLRASNVEALYVQRTSAPMIKPIIGIVTHTDIVNYYSSK